MAEVSRTKKVLMLTLGGTFNTVAFLLSSIIAARLLTKHDYATMKQTMLVYNFISPLLILGLAESLFYFLPKEKVRKKGIITEHILLLFFMAFLFSLFLIVGGDKFIANRFDNPDLFSTIRWLIPYPFFVMPATILGAILITQNKTFVFTMYKGISSLSLVILTVAGVLMTKSFSGPLMAQIYFPLLLLPVILWLSFKYVPGHLSMPRKDSTLNILKYSVPLGLAGMLGTMTLMIDKVIVSSMCTPEQFSNYVNGAIEIPLIGIITGSIASIILVDMVKYIDQGNKVEALKLFRKAAAKSASVLFPVMVFLLISGKAFILTLYSEKYIESVIPFYIYLLILPIRIVVFGSAMMSLGQTKAILFRSFFDFLINVIMSVIFVKYFGYLGAAVATIITLYFWTVPYNLHKIGQGFGVRFFKILPFKEIAHIMLYSIMASPIALIYIFNSNHPWFIQLAIAGFLYFPMAGLLLYKKQFIELPAKYQQYIPNIMK